MSQEFEWPPSDEVIQAHILELEVGPSAQPALPQRDPKVAAKQPDTATHFESDGTRKPRHQPAEPPPAEFTGGDWPLHSRAATTEFRDLTIERVPLVARPATGSPRVGHPVALRRTHFASYAATIAVSAVCASVATSYLEHRIVLKPSPATIRGLAGALLTRAASVIESARNHPAADASPAVASPTVASPDGAQHPEC